MLLRQIFEPNLAQFAYLIGCQRTGQAILIDPLRDIDRYQAEAASHGLTINAVAETHIHADFVSGAQAFASDPDLVLYLSAEGGPDWQSRWAEGRPKTVFVREGFHFFIGKIRFDVRHTPGHTPEHVSYLVTDEGGGAAEPMGILTGDFLFVGDVGRPDLLEQAAGITGTQEPGARALAASLRQLEKLPDHLLVLPAHGAGSACGKALGAVPFSTLGYERRVNPSLRLLAEAGEAAFVEFILSGQPDPPLYFARMKQVNRDGIAPSPLPWPLTPLSAEGVEAVGSRSGVQVLDTNRSGAAFASSHLPRAIHAPMPGPYFTTAAGSYLNPTDQVLLVVPDGTAAEEAIRQLYRIGLDRVDGWVSTETVKAAGLATGYLQRIDFGDWNPEQLEPGAAILDVRNRSEFAEGRLPRARNIPYTRLRPALGELTGETTWWVHCGTGKRASLAASFLQNHGRRVVYVDGICAACDRIAEARGLLH